MRVVIGFSTAVVSLSLLLGPAVGQVTGRCVDNCPDVEVAGDVISSGSSHEANAEACRSQCLARQECGAWTYWPTDHKVEDMRGTCWLKTHVTGVWSFPGAISGFK